MPLSSMNVNPKQIGESNNDYALRILTDNIMSLKLAPGEVLNDKLIAEKLGISRTPVREAFVCLRFRKLVTSFPQSHSYVSKINLGYVDEGIFLRHALEQRIIEVALAKASSTDIANLQYIIKQQRVAIDRHISSDFLFWDHEFHCFFFRIAGKPWCWENMQSITTHHRRTQQLVIACGDDDVEMLLPYEEHQRLFDMFISGELTEDFPVFLMKHIGYRRLLPILIEQYPDYFEYN